MNIEVVVAHAIHSDLDIVEAMPDLQKIPIEEIEPRVEALVADMQSTLSTFIRMRGWVYLEKNDAKGLCQFLKASGVKLPRKMLLKMCKRMVELYPIEERFEGELDCGCTLWSVRMTVDLREGSGESHVSP